MTQNLNQSHNFQSNGSYIDGFIQNVDTEQNHNHNPINLDYEDENPNLSKPSNNYFTKQTNKPLQQARSAFEIQLLQLQGKLFHQVILKSEMSNETDFDGKVLKKLSESIKSSLEDTLNDIQKTDERLENPLLNYLQKQQIKQALLELRMQQLAHSKVLVNTYRHHEYRLVIGLLHIAQIYLQLKCYQQALNHLQNAISLNDAYRQASKDVQFFHSLLLTYLALAQFEVQNINQSLQNLGKALEIHQQLKAHQYEFHEFFSLNLISKVLLCAGKQPQAITFGKMAIQSGRNDYSAESIEFATACKTLAEAQSASHEFESALEHIQRGIQVLQVHHPSKQESIIQFYQKLTELTLKKLTTLKPDNPAQNYFDQYLQTVKNKYTVIENTYGYRDKRAIKEKRHLASTLLKYTRIDQAEEELQDILEIQEVVYGEKSVEVARTLKLLGTVAMSQNESAKAQKLLKKSMGIFHDQGQPSLEKQVQAKLLILAGKGKFLLNNNSLKM